MARKAGQGEEEEVAQSQEAKREDASPPWREEDVGVTDYWRSGQIFPTLQLLGPNIGNQGTETLRNLLKVTQRQVLRMVFDIMRVTSRKGQTSTDINKT
ncbi:hypothetical protein STEG23_029819 [Scotinomys teguina]